MNKTLLICLIAAVFTASLDLEKARADMLTRHNEYRLQHQVDKLERLSDLESIAQSWAEKIAADRNLQHSSNKYKGNSLGENLYMGPLNDKLGFNTVDLWYNEYPNYDFNNPDWTPGAGHFTQVVWKSSKFLGCGAGCNTNNYCYVCCNYYPAGNYLTQFDKNVFPKSSTAPDTSAPDTAAPDTAAPDTAAPDTAAPDTAAPDTTVDPQLETFREDAKKRHNELRADHQVGSLERDSLLEKYALNDAKEMVAKDTYIFTTEKYNGEYIGENIFWAYGDFTGKGITDMWYKGVEKYNFNSPGYNSEAGGFTQVVWKNTKKIGCAYSCKGKECYGNCLYYPGGNYQNQFKENVFPKK
jgi:uncharacterized protein YkwD